ncbi:MAG: hypothetical protein GX647_05750 [Clostridiales bacterium]|jgi:hypothetical protein|nr:hypothetical protein [Clostridiales bacterium]
MNNPNDHQAPEHDFAETVCSPEFPEGCIEPADQAKPAEPEPAFPNSADDALNLCFTEDICSAEFIEGCMNPLKKKK